METCKCELLIAAKETVKELPEECQRYIAAAGNLGVLTRRVSRVQRTWNEKDGHNHRSVPAQHPHVTDSVSNPDGSWSIGEIHLENLSPVSLLLLRHASSARCDTDT